MITVGLILVELVPWLPMKQELFKCWRGTEARCSDSCLLCVLK